VSILIGSRDSVNAAGLNNVVLLWMPTQQAQILTADDVFFSDVNLFGLTLKPSWLTR
jgi:hypothetical protein